MAARKTTKRSAKKDTVKKGAAKKGSAKKRSTRPKTTAKKSLKASVGPATPAAALTRGGVIKSLRPMALKTRLLLKEGGTVYRALCLRGDFEGKRRATEAEARADALGHNFAGHVVKVLAEQSV